MAYLNREMREYVKREIAYDSVNYNLGRVISPLSHSISNYEGDPSVLCFLMLCKITYSSESALPHFVPSKKFVQFTQETNQSKTPNITIKEYFERLIKQDNTSKYDVGDDGDDGDYDPETRQTLTRAGHKAQTRKEEDIVITQSYEDGFKTRTPTQRQIAMDSFGAEIQRNLKNCAISNTLHVAYVLNRDRQLIPRKNTILGMIHEYTGKKKDMLPQTFLQLEEMFVGSVAVILLIPKNKKMPKRGGSKIEDTLPTFKSVPVKDDKNQEHLMFYSMQNEEVKFIIVDDLNMILGKIPAENFEKSSLVAALNTLNNINKQEEPNQQTRIGPKIGPQLEYPQTNNKQSSSNTPRKFDKQKAHTSQFESKINEAKPVPIPPKRTDQTSPVQQTTSRPSQQNTTQPNTGVTPTSSSNDSTQQPNSAVIPQTQSEKLFEQHMLRFFKQQLKQLIKFKNAKQFDNPPAVDKKGQLLKDKQGNYVHPGGYSQTIKALKSENPQSINFVLYRLNFAINRLDRL